MADLVMGKAGKGQQSELAATPSSPRPPEQLCAGLLWPGSQGITVPPDPTTRGQLRTAKGGIAVPSCFLMEVMRYLALEQARCSLSPAAPEVPRSFAAGSKGQAVGGQCMVLEQPLWNCSPRLQLVLIYSG